MFVSTITHMETNLEAIVENKLDEKMTSITAISEHHNRQDRNTNTGNKNNYAAALKKTEDFRLIMEEAKNEEIIEHRGNERRAKNFIVHDVRNWE